MKEKIKKYFYIPFILLLGIIVTNCTHKLEEGYESDEVVLGQAKKLQGGMAENKQEMNEREQAIEGEERLKDSLGENNKYLEKQLKEKKEEVLQILQEIYNDSRNSTTYTATCQACGKEVAITYDKFYQMASKYNTGWTRHYTYETSYKWFLWWEWEHKKFNYQTKSFEFHKCPPCMTQADMDAFQKRMSLNVDKIAQAEARIVKQQLKFKKSKAQFEERESSIDVFKHQARKNQQSNTARDQEKAEKIKAQAQVAEKERALAEKERELEEFKKQEAEKEKQVKLNMAKGLLINKVDMNVIIMVTGLLREEIEKISAEN